MKIDGKTIASEILSNLTNKVTKLKKKGITPTMAIILVGNNEASNIYVKQKTLKAKGIGANVKVFQTKLNAANKDIEKTIRKLDKNSNIHGIIIQRPAPKNIDAEKLNELISPIKEVDGFGSRSIYPVPVAEAVWKMLKNSFSSNKSTVNFSAWLKSKKIVVIGKGITAGHPIANHFTKNKIPFTTIDSKTKNKEQLLKSADIIVTAVGKHILNPSQVKKGVILIGVGIFSDKNGRLKGDYDGEDMESVAGFYSPTPGGVGPVNVACLMENLVKAAQNSLTSAS